MTVARNLYAAVEWLRAQRMAGSATPRYVVLPSLIPYASLWQRYIRLLDGAPVRMAWPAKVPLRGTWADVRLRALNKALRENGSAQAVARLLPYVRRGSGDQASTWGGALPRTTPRRALSLLYATGAHESAQGPSRWATRVLKLVEQRAHEATLAAEVKGPAYVRTATIQKHQAERIVRELRPLVPALQALDSFMERLLAGGRPRELVNEYCDFVRRWLLLPLADTEWDSLVASLEQWAWKESDWIGGRAFVVALDAALDQLWLEPEPVEDPEVVVALGRLQSQVAPVFYLKPGIDESLYLGDPCTAEANAATKFTSEEVNGLNAVEEIADSFARRNKVFDLHGKATVPWGLRIDPPLLPLWGLSARRPLSATALPALLTCPYRFLLERVAHVHPVPEVATPGPMDRSVFGSVVHEAVAAFLSAFGEEFESRKRDLAYWCAQARGFAERAFEAAKTTWPLWGEELQWTECQRVVGAVETLIRDEWARTPSQFVAAEHRFGEPDGIAVRLANGTIFLRGAVDWLVRLAPEAFVVRELKTGIHGSQPGRFSFRDMLQLGVYTLALEAAQSGLRGSVVGAELIRIAAGQVQRRVVAGEALEKLRQDTLTALQLGHDLLVSGCFPRTPDEGNCAHCPFLAHCGEEGAALAARMLPAASEPAARNFFRWWSKIRKPCRQELNS